jgi:hypothetical protein
MLLPFGPRTHDLHAGDFDIDDFQIMDVVLRERVRRYGDTSGEEKRWCEGGDALEKCDHDRTLG